MPVDEHSTSRRMTDRVPETPANHLRRLKEQLMTSLDAIDLALADTGEGDLVTWAGTASHEQRCRRCSYWIFLNDPIVTVMTTPGVSEYIHRKHVVRPSTALPEEGPR